MGASFQWSPGGMNRVGPDAVLELVRLPLRGVWDPVGQKGSRKASGSAPRTAQEPRANTRSFNRRTPAEPTHAAREVKLAILRLLSYYRHRGGHARFLPFFQQPLVLQVALSRPRRGSHGSCMQRDPILCGAVIFRGAGKGMSTPTTRFPMKLS